jgi:hypothetical protein
MSQFVSLATDTVASQGNTTASFIGGLLGYAITAIALMGVFKKAGEPAWAAWVPFYNVFVLTRIAGYNPWMFLLFLIPFVNIVFAIMVALGVGRAFGHGGAFSFFLLFLISIVGYFICGYSSDQFVGRGGKREALI